MTFAELVILGMNTIRAVLEAIQEAHDGKVTPDQAADRIKALRKALDANDAAADAALNARFSKETP